MRERTNNSICKKQRTCIDLVCYKTDTTYNDSWYFTILYFKKKTISFIGIKIIDLRQGFKKCLEGFLIQFSLSKVVQMRKLGRNKNVCFMNSALVFLNRLLPTLLNSSLLFTHRNETILSSLPPFCQCMSSCLGTEAQLSELTELLSFFLLLLSFPLLRLISGFSVWQEHVAARELKCSVRGLLRSQWTQSSPLPLAHVAAVGSSKATWGRLCGK